MDGDATTAEALASAAERFDELADVAELMGDEDGAARLRAAATNHRLEAFEILDRG